MTKSFSLIRHIHVIHLFFYTYKTEYKPIKPDQVDMNWLEQSNPLRFFLSDPPPSSSSSSKKGGGDIVTTRFEPSLCVCSSVLAGGVVALERYTVVICGVTIQMSDYRICFYFFAGSMFFTMIAALMYKFPVSVCSKLYWYSRLFAAYTVLVSSLYSLTLFLKNKLEIKYVTQSFCVNVYIILVVV